MTKPESDTSTIEETNITSDNRKSADARKRSFLALGIGTGVAIGAGIGVATGNLAMGVALGVAIGTSLGLALGGANRSN